MQNEKNNLTPRALNKDNIRDFAFLVPEDVVNDILSEDGTSGFAALLGVKNKPAKYAGAVCGRFINRTVYAITSIYVSEQYRRQGVGTFLLETLLDILDGMDAEIDIRVNRIHKDEAGLVKFLEKNDFEEIFSESERTYVIDLANTMRARFSDVNPDLPIVPFSRVPISVFKSFDPEQQEGFVPMPLSGLMSKNIDRELSMAIVSEGKLSGFCVIEDYLEKCPILSALWVEKPAPVSHIMSIISAVRDAAVNKYDTDANIFIPTVNDKMAEMLERIFPAGGLKEGTMHYKLRVPEKRQQGGYGVG